MSNPTFSHQVFSRPRLTDKIIHHFKLCLGVQLLSSICLCLLQGVLQKITHPFFILRSRVDVRNLYFIQINLGDSSSNIKRLLGSLGSWGSFQRFRQMSLGKGLAGLSRWSKFPS
mmetsp:Transcript_26417/g.76169  ORF Transcript_26417/g.76169 Transcript_26417/m.76169 type:complete len:115 (-) Transcript_26417:114-458(-)